MSRLRRVFYRQILRQEISWFDLSDGGDLSTKLSEYVTIIYICVYYIYT